MNEPTPPVDRTALQNYFIESYKQIRATGNQCILLVTPFLSEQDANHLYGMISAPQYVNVWNEIHAYFIWGYDGVSEQQILAETGIFSNLDNFRELGRKQLDYYNADATGGWAFWTWRHSDETIKRTGWSMRDLIRKGYLTLS
ncbi:hypothetical protein PRIC1_011884 [Phytophthora ramorum]